MTSRPAPPPLLALTAALPFLALSWLLAPEWNLHPHYSFGWLMPALTAFLLWKRWPDRPPPGPTPPPLLLAIPLILAALAWPILLVIHGANPDWRLILWAAAALAALTTAAGLLALGGLPWLRHFAFPATFFLLAIPWPSGLETAVVTTLMGWVASACVESLNWLGHVALQQGNLIKLPQGTIGVDEACSGIRSLQANLMAALFVGELYRRSLPARLLLVLGGLLLSLTLNFIRALALALLWIHHGNPAMDTWHDPAGHLILLLSFIILVAVGRKPSPQTPSTPPPSPLHPLSTRACTLALAATLLGPVLAQLWFTLRSAHQHPTRPAWTLLLPQGPAVQTPELPQAVSAMLRYDHGHHRLWFADDGTVWSLFDFEWLPGKHSARLARAHSPEVCLPAAGARLTPQGSLSIPLASGSPLTFQQFQASIGGQTLHVFYLRWQDDPEPSPSGRSPLDRAERLRMAWLGRKEQRQRVIQLMTEGQPNPDAARQAAAAWLSAHLQTIHPF